MTEIQEHDLTTEPNDAELISRVRGGDVSAYGLLFSRHVEAANRLARQLINGPDADDLVSESFVKVLNVLQGGGGPDLAFRAYLLTALRRLHIDKIRSTKKATPTDDLTPYDAGVPFNDTTIAGFEGGAAAKAFASLPERWQLVLWHLEVEGQKPADIAPLLGMSANSVSALAYRAREGLRQAFLNMHINDLVEDDCRWTHDHLGAYVRNGLSKRDDAKVREHLDGCRKCTAIYLELTEVNSGLAGLIGPLVLGGATAGYLGSTTAAGGAATGAAGGIVLLLDRAKDFLIANSTAALGAGAVAAAAVAVVAGVAVNNANDKAEPVRNGAQAPVTSQPVDSSPVAPATLSNGDPTPGSPLPSIEALATPSATPTPAFANPGVVVRRPTQSSPTPAPGTPAPASPSSSPPPAALIADVAVSSAQFGATPLGAQMRARVTGIPAGKAATLRVTSTGGLTLNGMSAGCTAVNPNSLDCRMTNADPTISFEVLNLMGSATVTFTVFPVPSYDDPVSGNNRSSETISF